MRKGGQYRADDDGNIVKVEPTAAPPAGDTEGAAFTVPTEAPAAAPIATDTTTARSRRDRKG